MILLLEEMTTPASLETLYSQFHFAEPGGSRAKNVAKRLISIWPSIVKIVNHWDRLPESKQICCKIC